MAPVKGKETEGLGRESSDYDTVLRKSQPTHLGAPEQKGSIRRVSSWVEIATQHSHHDHSLVETAWEECYLGSHAVVVPNGPASGSCQIIALLTGERPFLS